MPKIIMSHRVATFGKSATDAIADAIEPLVAEFFSTPEGKLDPQGAASAASAASRTRAAWASPRTWERSSASLLYSGCRIIICT